MESLKDSRFTPLSKKQMNFVRGGGETTKGGSEYDHIEWSDDWVDDGQGGKRHRYRVVNMTWGSDEQDGKETCRYDSVLVAGPWK